LIIYEMISGFSPFYTKNQPEMYGYIFGGGGKEEGGRKEEGGGRMREEEGGRRRGEGGASSFLISPERSGTPVSLMSIFFLLSYF
jgi:hypothetical protein